MPIIIPKDLPAYDILSCENIFVINEIRAISQDIRPIEIAIVNLMPTKIETETQLMRLLGNTPLQVNVTLVKTGSYRSKNTSQGHLDKFYTTFSKIQDRKFDGMIITGAPVETLDFYDVKYWNELTKIFNYADKNVTSTIFICWGAQAALHYYYGINKSALDKKIFGVYANYKTVEFDPLLKGSNDYFDIPQSRYTSIDEDAVRSNPELVVLAQSDVSGISIIKSIDNRKFFFTGHMEYDRDTLKKEYLRDIEKGLKIDMPENYFIDKDKLTVNMTWCNTANLIFYNWINHYVYQVTPYNKNMINK